MNANSPQMLYLVIFLPSLFGLILCGDGINKIRNSDNLGYFNLVFGVLTFIMVAITYYVFQTKRIPFLGI